MVNKLVIFYFLLIQLSFSESCIEFKNEKGFTALLPYSSGSHYSVMGWIKLPEMTSESDCVFALGENNMIASAFSLYYKREQGAVFTFFMGNGVSWKYIDLKQNSWNHFAAIFNPKTKKVDLYINGAYSLSSVQPQFPMPVRPDAFKLSLGVNLDGVEGLKNVSYDDVSVWKGALTALQVEENYNFGLGKKLTSKAGNLVAYFDFNEGKGHFLKDVKGHSGTIKGNEGVDFVWSKEPQRKSLLREYIQHGDRVKWSFSSEAGVAKCIIINSKTAEVIKVIKPGGADSYSIKVNEAVETQLLIVSSSGYQRIFSPSKP